MSITVKIQYLHPFFRYPLPTLILVRELLSRDRHRRPISQPGEHLKCGVNIVRTELNYEIDILCEAQIAVRIDRKPTCDEVAYARAFQRRNKSFEAGKFHGVNIIYGLSSSCTS